VELERRVKSTDADPPYETSELGTPADYTPDVYRVYFEVPDASGLAGTIIADFIGAERAAAMVTLAHGYETELPIQCVPEIVRLLVAQNIAVYQVVRYAKTNRTWA
jgi:hypothetical protein